MYFSKIRLPFDLSSTYHRYKLEKDGFYAVHQLLWRLFEGNENRQFLFRQEEMDGGIVFYCLSKDMPQNKTENKLHLQTKLFCPKLNKGQKLYFNLRANPTVYITNADGRGQRHDVLMHAKYKAKEHSTNSAEIAMNMEQAAIAWLSDGKRLQRWGISLINTPVVSAYRQQSSLKKKSKQQIRFSSVDYEGILEINDPEVFLEQYFQGFGAAKSFGCGLMLLKVA